jgi:hypothetical protein
MSTFRIAMLNGFLAPVNNNSILRKPLKTNQADAKIAVRLRSLLVIVDSVERVAKPPRNRQELQVKMSAMLSKRESAPVVRVADLPTSWRQKRPRHKSNLTQAFLLPEKCLLVVS